jgi:hypothetical protein
LERALFAVQGSEHVAVGPTLSALPGCAYDAALGAPVELPPVTVRVGRLPVVLTPQVRFSLHASGTGSAAVAYGVSQDVTMTAGAEYGRRLPRMRASQGQLRRLLG